MTAKMTVKMILMLSCLAAMVSVSYAVDATLCSTDATDDQKEQACNTTQNACEQSLTDNGSSKSPAIIVDLRVQVWVVLKGLLKFCVGAVVNTMLRLIASLVTLVNLLLIGTIALATYVAQLTIWLASVAHEKTLLILIVNANLYVSISNVFESCHTIGRSLTL